jgi:hypothetical protein
MADDTHPADDLIEAVRGIWNGDNIKQAMRDAWDRIVSKTTPSESTDTSFHDEMLRNANKSFADQDAADKAKLTPKSAAAIRSKAGKTIGK